VGTRVRRLLTALALVVGASVASLMVASPAQAIPMGGWCYNQWYEFGSDNGETFQQYDTALFQRNGTSVNQSWTPSKNVSTTFTSSYTVNQSFHLGFDIWLVKASVDYSIGHTTTMSTTVTTTTSFTIPVIAPGVTMWAAYGGLYEQTSGTYYEEKHGCDNGDFSTTISGAVSGSSLKGVGWVTWQT